MSEPPSTYFRRLFEHEQTSHAKVLIALEDVPAAKRAAPEFQKALDLLAHVVAARRLWLVRLGVAELAIDGIEPKGTKLADLSGRLEEVHALWSRYLAHASDAEIARTIEYKSLDAGRFRNTVSEVLTQLHGHSLYHRGQIALCLRALGCTPPTTDFIYFARVPLG